MSNMRLVMRQAFRNMDSFLDFIFCNIIRRIDNPGATSEVEGQPPRLFLSASIK